jgi:hypothetical protein
MGVLPDTRLAQLEYCESKNPVWTAQAANLNLTTGMMTTLVSLTTAARAQYNAMVAAHSAARAATQSWYDAQEAMRDKAAEYIKTIKAYAGTTNNPNVFNLAQIPPPKAPSASTPPATPANVTATLLNSGAIQLDWKGSLSHGVSFTIWRRFGAEANVSQIGTISGAKTFIDTGLPVGIETASGVWYQVRAERVGLVSDFSEPIFVRFGAVATPNDGQSELKIAA